MDNQSIDMMPLEELIVPVVVPDIKKQSREDPDYKLTATDVDKWESKNGKIPDGSLIVGRSHYVEKDIRNSIKGKHVSASCRD
uniref:Cyclase n=1 Tax=Candidatus Kentrum sp. TUN TaxID=2126343 RepID=A0A450ZTK2_9GAMM|nr:MAG: Putative cyclase [Candidatus Kentron sp. TUN]VFK57095.1 MAG: Putative cyclase [Candidatus Kentron sp. TUN]